MPPTACWACSQRRDHSTDGNVIPNGRENFGVIFRYHALRDIPPLREAISEWRRRPLDHVLERLIRLAAARIARSGEMK